MEKCSFCVQRLRRAERKIEGQEGGRITDKDMAEGHFGPACVQACPTNTLIFGDFEDPDSQVREHIDIDTVSGDRTLKNPRAYQLLANLGTEPNVIYLKKIDPHYKEDGGHA
jgi:molybdopterin-containing oxidoreductase family iron-sulfur binding subunit